VTAPELHADDLLDRESRGVLTSEERAHLEAHLAACAVCRFERAVRADFRAEFEAQEVVRTPAPAEQADSPVLPSGPRIRRSRMRLLALVAVLLLLAGVATAELSGAQLLARVGLSAPPLSAPTAVASARLPVKVRKTVLSAPHDEVAVAAAPSASSVSPDPAPSGVSAPRGVPVPAVASATAPSSASGLFDDARAARERGDYAIAVELYERLLALFPSSPQALTTHAIVGRLLLDRGDPHAALRHFDAYISSGGSALGEEAELGRALAFGKLGQSMQEADAWRALLRQYPSSLHAARARERLSALGAE
jgi:tetratricopeptide (TPR) repeat protein